MSWAKIDDDFYDHPKVLRAGLEAVGLFAVALSYSARKLLDGKLSREAVERLAHGRDWNDLASRLVDAELWERDGEGFVIHDYLKFNPSAKHVKRHRKAAIERMQKARKRARTVRANTTRTLAEHAEHITRSSPLPVPDPVPVPLKDIKDSFERFWEAYPRKVGRISALKAWTKLRPSTDLVDRILAAIAKQVPTWTEPQFIPHPATWLNAGRWDDEVTARQALVPARDSRLPKPFSEQEEYRDVWVK